MGIRFEIDESSKYPNKAIVYTDLSQADTEKFRTTLKARGWDAGTVWPDNKFRRFSYGLFVGLTAGDLNALKRESRKVLDDLGLAVESQTLRPIEEIEYSVWARQLETWLEDYINGAPESDECELDTVQVFLAIEQGDIDRAEATLDSYLAVGGSADRSLPWRLRILFARRSWTGLLRLLNEYPAHAERAPYSYMAGRAALGSRQYSVAVSYLSQALEHAAQRSEAEPEGEGSHREILGLLGEACRGARQPAEALAWYRRYLVAGPLPEGEQLEEVREQVMSACDQLIAQGEEGTALAASLLVGLPGIGEDLLNEYGLSGPVLADQHVQASVDTAEPSPAAIEPLRQFSEARRLWNEEHDLEGAVACIDEVGINRADQLAPADRREVRQLYIRLLLRKGETAQVIDTCQGWADVEEDSELAGMFGLALYRAEHESEALRWLEVAVAGGFVSPETDRALGDLLLSQAPERSAFYLHRALEGSVWDPDTVELLLLAEEDPARQVDLCEAFFSKVEPELKRHSAIFSVWKEAALQIHALESAAKAVSEWADTLVRANKWDMAYDLVRELENPLGISALYLDVLSTLEASDELVHRKAVADEYRALGQKLLSRMNPDLVLLREIRMRLFYADHGLFKTFEEQYAELRQRQLAHPDVAGQPVPEKLDTGAAKVDLSGIKLVLVGGDRNVRGRVFAQLGSQHGLKKWQEVPPRWEANLGESDIRQRLTGADRIVVVHRCLKHADTYALQAALGDSDLDLTYVIGKGHTAIIRTVLAHFSVEKQLQN